MKSASSLFVRWGLAVTLLVMSPAVSFATLDPDEQARVDAAIVRALEFLAREQQSSGAWRTASAGESTAATSLAIMAFMAAGHVPGEGPYAVAIDRGIRWLLAQQDDEGVFSDRNTHGRMYCHGISTLMLAEVLGMTPEAESANVRRALERAVRVILLAQNVRKDGRNAGGWRYQPTSNDSDLSVTGWQLLALRAAKNVGCDVPAENIDRAVAYVKRCSVRDNQGFAYQPSSGASAVRTGTGILALEICGEHHSAEAMGGADYLLRRPLQYRDAFFFYGAYYCGLGMFQIGGRHWEETQEHLVDILLSNQQRDGSWESGNGLERDAGQIYSTSMAVLSLAVEYQYLPIYQR